MIHRQEYSEDWVKKLSIIVKVVCGITDVNFSVVRYYLVIQYTEGNFTQSQFFMLTKYIL
jgi:hypothetical protein